MNVSAFLCEKTSVSKLVTLSFTIIKMINIFLLIYIMMYAKKNNQMAMKFDVG